MRTLVTLAAALSGCAILPGGGRGTAPPPAATRVPAELAWVERVATPRHLERPETEEAVEIGRAIQELAASDFSVYCAAARRLIEIGEPAVPYLGHAGQEPARSDRLGEVIPIVLKPVLMESAPDHVGVHLGSPYVLVRTTSAAVAGERRLTEHAAALVELLEDPRLEVRRAGIAALRRMSNRFFGYRPGASESDRAEAVEKWRAMWS